MRVTKEVYDLLGVAEEEKDTPWPGGVAVFEDVPYDTIKEITDMMGHVLLEEAQNSSPTVEEFLDVLKDYKENTTFSGYVVSKRRRDERISIDAVTTTRTDDNILFLRFADDFQFIGEDKLYAWFD